MAKSRNDILFRFLADTKSLEKGGRKAQGSMKKTQRATSALTKGLGLLGGTLAAGQLANYAGDAVQLAVAAEEVDSKFEAVFGTAKDLTAALQEWGDVAGVTDSDAKELAATFGNLAQAQGISASATEDLTVDVATLAGDMASFNDIDPAIVFQDLNKALLTTEREGMKKYGIAVTEAEVKTRAAEIAAKDGRKEVTKADRAYASYAIVVEQAGKAVGDLDRTSDSLANTQRRMKARAEELQTELGRRLLPAYKDLLDIGEDLIPILGGVAGKLADTAADAGELIGPVAELVGGLSDMAASADDAAGSGSFLSDTFDILGGNVFGLTRMFWDRGPGALPSALGITKTKLDDVAEATVGAGLAMGQLPDNLQPGIDALLGVAGAAGLADENLDRLSDAEILGGGNDIFDLAGSIARRDALRRAAATRGTNGSGNLEGFHTGGVVGGPAGSNQAIMAKGGERVTSRGHGGGGDINITIEAGIGDPVAIAEQVRDLLNLYDRTNGSF